MSCRSMLGALLLGAVGALPLIGHADALEDIVVRKTVRIAVPEDFPPFGSVGRDFKPVGYDIDTAKMIAADMGVVLEIVPVTSANRIPYLTTGKVDMIISSLGKNPEREKVIDFSVNYAPFFNGVFGVAAEKVAAPADLAGKIVGVTRGAIEDIELSKVAPASTVIKRFEDNNTTLSAYLSGQVNLIATGNVVAAAITEKRPGKPLQTKFLIKNSPCSIGVNKNEPALLARINSIIAKAKQDGSLNQASLRWFKAPLQKDL